MGHDKLTWALAGLPVLRRTLDAFLAADTVSSIIVVCSEERWSLLGAYDFPKPVTRADGGESRQESVARGLAAVDTAAHLVAVHDGARPLVSPEDIDNAVRAAMEHRAAALARRATETMKRSDAEDFCAESVCRENLWCMETPQVFELALLREAYEAVTAQGLQVTDEVSAVQAIGTKVKFVEARHPNLKITTPADLALAEALLQKQS
jgi:2-C-methyl-D-erythritol 4-phosphate cytidylyltransferase